MYLDEVATSFRPGLSADVTIMTDERKDTLYIPRRAVLEAGLRKYVRIPVNGAEVEQRFIETGLRADNGFIEVLNGLEIGEEIVISIRE